MTTETQQHAIEGPPRPESPDRRRARRPAGESSVYYGEPYNDYGPGYYYETREEDAGFLGNITVARILRILRRKWLTLALAAGFGVAAAFFRLSLITPLYRATSVIEVNVRKPRILGQPGAMIDDGSDSRTTFVTRLAKFEGKATRELAADRFMEFWTGDPMTRQQALRIVGGGARFSQRGGTSLINVQFVHSDPEVAACAANAFAQAAEAHTFDENKATSDSAVAWLQSQAGTQRDLLAKSEKALADFRAANNIDVLQSEKRSAEESVLALNAAQAELESQIVIREEMYKAVEIMKPGLEEAASLPTGLPREGQIAGRLKHFQELTVRWDEIRKRYTMNHPEAIALSQQLATARQQLLQEIEMSKATLQKDIEVVRNQSQGLLKRVGEKSQKVAELERTIVELLARLTTMERERDAYDVAYRGILNRIEEARLSADEDTAIVKVAELARTPGAPFTPQRSRMILVGLFLGLAGGLGLALVTDTLEDRVTSFRDIETSIGLKVLGLVPHVSGASRGVLALAGMNRKFSQVTESFAGIRGLLNSSQYHEYTHVILIASAAPEEGKTITACNLAIASAKGGRRTLLVDFDMRRPRLRGIFKEPDEQHSLLHVLEAGDPSRFQDLACSTDCPDLYVVTSRPSDSISPAETVGGHTVHEFIKWAREGYDRVVIDSPPFGIVGDAAVLAALADGVIIVCRPDKSRRRGSKHAVSQFTDMGANMLGAIVNDVDFRKNGYFSNYDYRHSYYQYGYGHYGEKKKSGKKSGTKG